MLTIWRRKYAPPPEQSPNVRLDPTATTLAEFFGEFRALVEDGLTSNASQAYARSWIIRVEPTLGALPLAVLRPLAIAKAMALWSGA